MHDAEAWPSNGGLLCSKDYTIKDQGVARIRDDLMRLHKLERKVDTAECMPDCFVFLLQNRIMLSGLRTPGECHKLVPLWTRIRLATYGQEAGQ